MSEGVEFARLGLAVIDEQHRFGVRQRGALAEKAANPHLLVMSATPIPRTLGLLIYGDLDISILDELPPGRTPVKTRCITGKRRQDLYRFLDSEIDKGRQVTRRRCSWWSRWSVWPFGPPMTGPTPLLVKRFGEPRPPVWRFCAGTVE